VTLTELEALLPGLPRRCQNLLVDRLVTCTPGDSARGIRMVTANESFFQGHFPDYPVMPGVLVLEALIQLSTLLACSSGAPAPGNVHSLDRVRFKRQVIPGDVLVLDTRMAGEGKFIVRASVGDETATEAEIVLAPDAAGAADA
jgi:3-hydroxyacyl-[acyl-carrier-protein] dehydratase